MFSKVIVGYDGSEQARDALALGIELKDATGAELVLARIVVWEPIVAGPGLGLGVPTAPRPGEPGLLSKEALAGLAEPAQAARATPAAEVSTSAARGLGEIAERSGADMIVVGSSHRGPVGRVLMGSVGERLLHGSRCAIAIAPAGYADRDARSIRTVGVGFDGDEESTRALGVAAMVAEEAGAVLDIVAVAPGDFMTESLEQAVDWGLSAIEGEVRARGAVSHGDPADELSSLDVDLLVLGSRRYGPLRSVLLGGVSLPLVRSATAPVLVVPRGARVPDAAAVPANGGQRSEA